MDYATTVTQEWRWRDPYPRIGGLSMQPQVGAAHFRADPARDRACSLVISAS
jgi:hypothetical protein